LRATAGFALARKLPQATQVWLRKVEVAASLNNENCKIIIIFEVGSNFNFE
jgi:hypothetical protein